MAGKKKGSPKTGGRKKGTKNKLPRDLKTRVIAVWDKLEEEGKDLFTVASEKPDWFYVNFVKPMLPKDVQIEGDIGVKVIRIESNVDK